MIWCSNDYLGMGQHPKVIGAMVETATRMGAGAGGTRNIAGTNHPLVELEAELADLHGKEAALVFTSGYVSNQTGISTIAKLLPNCLILSDAWNHNSMIEGVRQAGAEKAIWRHNDVDAPRGAARRAAARAAEADRLRGPLLDGRRRRAGEGDLRSRREIRRDDLLRRGARGRHVRPARRRHLRARRADAPRRRAGRHARQGLRLPRRLHRGERATSIDAVRSYAPGFIFTTALPPAVCAGVVAAIRHLKESDWERERHQDRAARVKAVLHAAGLPVMASETHIVPLFVGDPEKCKQASDMLLADHGIYIQPINYPTVPRGTERLRITPSPYHEDALIDALAEALVDVWQRLELPFGNRAMAAE